MAAGAALRVRDTVIIIPLFEVFPFRPDYRRDSAEVSFRRSDAPDDLLMQAFGVRWS